MLGEKPGERHDAELRPKVYLGKTFHLKQPQGRREEYLDSPRAARRTFLVPDSDQEPALPLYILLSATVRRFPFRLTGPGDTTTGHADGSGASAINDQTLRKISVPFVPPKPNEFDIATSIFIFRALFAT